MAKSIKFKNNNYLDSKGITHNKKLLNEILENILYLLKSSILYESESGIVAGASGNSVGVNEPVTNFSAILIIHASGGCIVNNKLNQYNTGYNMSIWWFNNGYTGTFYNNTIYKIVGIGRL